MMSDPFFDVDLLKLRSKAEKVTNLIFNEIFPEQQIHLETAIAAAAGLAGLVIIRESELTLDKFNPGQEIMSEVLREAATRHAQFMIGMGQVVGLSSATGWGDSVPKNHLPLETVFNLNAILEAPFSELCQEINLDPTFRSRVALITSVKLILKGTGILDPDIGKSIAYAALNQAATRAPYPAYMAEDENEEAELDAEELEDN